MITTFENNLSKYVTQINRSIAEELQHLEKTAPSADHPYIKQVYRNIFHYLENGGKRMHGISIALAYAGLKGEMPSAIWSLAAGFQLYHHHTLVHDDIYDEDMTRRKQTAVHHEFYKNFNGEGKDALFSDPEYHLFISKHRRLGAITGFAQGKIIHAAALKMLLSMQFPDVVKLKVAQILNYHDLTDNAAQLRDVYHEGNRIPTPEECIAIARAKTGMLFRMGVRCACVAAAAPQEVGEALETWIESAAIGYQLQDDLEDLYVDSEKGQGRGVGVDLLKSKPTFIMATTFQEAKGNDLALLRSWQDNGQQEAQLPAILDIILRLQIPDICRSRIERIVEEGNAALDSVKHLINPQYFDQLKEFAWYFVSKNYWKRNIFEKV